MTERLESAIVELETEEKLAELDVLTPENMALADRVEKQMKELKKYIVSSKYPSRIEIAKGDKKLSFSYKVTGLGFVNDVWKENQVNKIMKEIEELESPEYIANKRAELEKEIEAINAKETNSFCGKISIVGISRV